MFVDFFIRRPVFATVCALFIILAGAISIPTLPIAEFPDLAPPQVIVSSGYIGANAQTVESAVTIPLEQSINGVEGMKYISSTSGNDGTSQITVVFDVSRNVDLASVDVQNRVNQALGRLPNEVKNTGIIITKQIGGFVFGAGVYSENGEYDSLFLSNYLDVYVKDALKRVKGVGDAIVFGERKYAMRLWLDPAKMAQRGLTATNVLSALQEQNVQVAAGQIGQPPSPEGQSFQISVRAAGRLSEASQFDNIILKTGSDGTLVRVKDVGRAELGAENYGTLLRFNGHDAVGLAVTQLPGANALDVDKAAKAELERLSKSFPPGLKAAVAFDTTTVIGESIRDVLITLLEAIVLVILVIFLFLQDWRSTFIPAITIPVSLIGTFAFVKLLGFSINTLTLFGITLATGLVVDDAIVVIENVERHIVEGISEPHNAASAAMKEVAGAVIATSLVLVAVFVPVALFPGTTGILFRQFALTIAFSVSISAFNALTLTPALSAIFLGHHRARAQGWFFKLFNKVFEAGASFYRSTVRRALDWRFASLLLFLGVLGCTYALYQRVPRAFIQRTTKATSCSSSRRSRARRSITLATFAAEPKKSFCATRRLTAYSPLWDLALRARRPTKPCCTPNCCPSKNARGKPILPRQSLSECAASFPAFPADWWLRSIRQQCRAWANSGDSSLSWKTWGAIPCKAFRTQRTSSLPRETRAKT